VDYGIMPLLPFPWPSISIINVQHTKLETHGA
jgi:hypothetical protein